MSEAMTRQERYEHGRQVLDSIDGEAGAKVVNSLEDVAPELGHQVVAWSFGEIYARPGLESRDRQLVTLGMLTALGGCEPQLEVHYTKGSGFYSTYPGMHVPTPIAIRALSPTKSIRALADEVMALSKMNWNQTRLDGRLPVTLRTADQVKRVLRFVDSSSPVAARYAQ